MQGTLRELNPINPDVPHGWLDPEPWADEAERTKWLLIVPTAITGRRLSASNAEWAFSVHAYL